MIRHTQDGMPKNRAKGMVCECNLDMSYGGYFGDDGVTCAECGLRRVVDSAEKKPEASRASRHEEEERRRRAAAVANQDL